MLRQLILTALLQHLIIAAFAQEWGTVGFVPVANRYDDIYFIDSLIGWTVNSVGEIFKTDNGGITWDTSYTGTGYLRSIEFLDKNVGFCGSLDGSFLQTLDGGNSWQDIRDRIPGPETYICGLSHVGDIVFGVGVWAYPAYFIKSTDRGTTWTYLSMSNYARGLVDCHFFNADTGIVSGILDGAVILRTEDGGVSWTEVYHGNRDMEYAWKLFFVNDSIGFASIESFGAPTYIVKTTDAGHSWTEYEVSPAYLDIQGIGFIDQNRGWVSPRYDYIFETTDGGLTWIQDTMGMFNVNRYFKVSNHLMYASGSKIHKYDDHVSFGDPGDTFSMHEILEIKPNPFSTEFVARIRIGKNTRAKLDLVSADGKQYATLYDGMLNSGIHFFSYDSRDLYQIANGISFLFLRTNEGFQAKQIVRTYH